MSCISKLILDNMPLFALAFFAMAGVSAAQQTEPLIETFDGGWRSGERTVDCNYNGQSHRLEVENEVARLFVDDEYKLPMHIRFSPGSVLYIYEDEVTGIKGVAFDFVNNEMVARDFVPGESKSNPYSDRIPCEVVK